MPHHTEDGFKNVHKDYQSPDFWDLLQWRWGALWKEIPDEEDYSFPLASPQMDLIGNPPADKIVLTWVGHATFLLQMNGVNILTDPHFTDRASPVSWAGPKRVVAPGLPLDRLPRVDVVVLSHDHYDSLDVGSIRQLRQRPGGKDTLFLVPLGLKAWFEDQGVTRVKEVDWWDEVSVKGLRFIATPTQHWSKRSLFARNKTLWAGWAVLGRQQKVYFLGDSGYSSDFKEIGRRLGPFDLALLPIGAYEPRWFMKAHHMNPAEAVEVHKEVRAKQSVAMHWGTFILTDEPLTEPPKALKKALRQQNVPEKEFRVFEHGQTEVFPVRPDGSE